MAVVAFLLGALGGGRLANRFAEHRGRMLATATVIEALLVAISLALVVMRLSKASRTLDRAVPELSLVSP